MSSNGSSQYRPAVGSDQYFHEALCLGEFPRPTDASHHALAHQHRSTRRPRLGLGHADAPKGRIDKKTVAQDPV